MIRTNVLDVIKSKKDTRSRHRVSLLPCQCLLSLVCVCVCAFFNILPFRSQKMFPGEIARTQSSVLVALVLA